MLPPAPPTAVEAVRPTLVTYLVLVTIVVVPLVVLLSPYLVGVASGLVLAVLCQPIYARLRRYLRPMWCGVVVTVAACLLVLVPVALVAVGGIRQATEVLGTFEGRVAPTALELAESIRRWVPLSATIGTPAELADLISTALGDAAGAASGVLFGWLQALPNAALQLVLVVLAMYFFLVDGRALFRWIASKLPLSRPIADTLVLSFRGATSAVVLASVVSAGAQASCMLVAFLVLGVPTALLAALASFVLAWIPTLGTLPVWVAGALWLYGDGHPGRATLMVGAGLVIGIVDNVVRPMVLRGRQEMHPLLSLLAILGGLAAFGIPGVFLGPLVASLAISVLDIWPAVASHCGIAVSGSGDAVPVVQLNPGTLGGAVPPSGA